jgi:hypothetical protein
MPDVRYVCISDMHLGEEDSLLTNLTLANTGTDPASPSPVMIALVDCLRDILSHNAGSIKPTLILNGDILELALTTDNQAMMVFERFIELIMAPGKELFSDIIYLPGNHDHHLWELARETQYINYLKTIEPGNELPAPWHTTNMLLKGEAGLVPSYSLSSIVRRYTHLGRFTIKTAYPNFALFQESTRKSIVFHHGHYVESLYHLMTTLTDLIFPKRKHPGHIWEIEAENFAWIDFFWSTMGRSGDVGEDVELIYEKLQDKEQLKELLYSLAESLARRYDLPGWGDKMEAQIAKFAFSALMDHIYNTERKQTEQTLSADAERGLRAYMNGPLMTQILTEIKEVPPDVTFVFGHTHKPFQEDMDFKGYPHWVNVYNTGGWVVETVDPEPLHGGAIVLVDEDLNALSLSMYNESKDRAGYAVSIQEAGHPGEPRSPFYKRLTGLINPNGSPWKDFSDATAGAVNVRAQNLRARINEKCDGRGKMEGGG